MELKILNDINDDIIDIRTEAFVEQRGISKDTVFDGRDNLYLHFCVYDDEKIVACLRAEAIDNYIHIGRVAVRGSLRKSGYGKSLIGFLCDYAKENGFEFVELSSMDSAQGFYERCGFVAEGDYYDEEGISHIYMKKLL